MTAVSERSDQHYADLGVAYYAAGRWAAFTIPNPVAGNLLHHAVEFFLKGDFSRTKSAGDLKKYGHDLLRLWRVYKQEHPTTDLTDFDECIERLHKFESIRYPDLITEKGAATMISIFSPQTPVDTIGAIGGGKTLPTYHVVVNEADELVRAIFCASSFHPDAFFAPLHSEAKKVLYRDNSAFQPQQTEPAKQS